MGLLYLRKTDNRDVVIELGLSLLNLRLYVVHFFVELGEFNRLCWVPLPQLVVPQGPASRGRVRSPLADFCGPLPAGSPRWLGEWHSYCYNGDCPTAKLYGPRVYPAWGGRRV
jgi:hypothetical protein